MIRPSRRLLARIVLLAVAVVAHSWVLLAQDASLQFEAASVRASDPAPLGPTGGRRGQVPNSPDRLTYERVLFRRLLMDAYGVERDQIKGPVWATADAVAGGALFDISAKAPAGATKEQVAVMLQNLLKERFHLSLHHETAESSGYALVAAKSGPKLKASAGPVAESERNPAKGRVNLHVQQDGFPELFPDRNMGGVIEEGTVRIRFRDYPLADLVQQLSFALAAHVINRTELADNYDFTLQFTLPGDGFSVGSRFVLPLAPGRAAALNGNEPSPGQKDALPAVSAAMERQLGLKLEPFKVAVDTLVIDHVEQTPTPN